MHRGDIVAVVETDKGAIEIEIFEDAIVAELLVALDTEVPVGTPLARLDRVGEHAGAAPVRPSTSPQAGVRPPPAPPTAAPPKVAAPPRKVEAPPVATRRKISPAARQHARERGIDLDLVVGSGDGGVVTVADVERWVCHCGEGTGGATCVHAATTHRAADDIRSRVRCGARLRPR